MFILFICVLITSRFKPFLDEGLSQLEQLSISVSLLTSYCGLFYISELKDDERVIVFTIIIASNAIFAASVGIYVARELRQKKKGYYHYFRTYLTRSYLDSTEDNTEEKAKTFTNTSGNMLLGEISSTKHGKATPSRCKEACA